MPKEDISNIMKYIFFLLIAFLPSLGLACSMVCPTAESMFNSSEIVFYGRVDKVKKYGLKFWITEPKIRVYFDIRKTWKGKMGDEPVKTTHNKFSCEGYYFEKDTDYVVFLGKSKKVNLCSVRGYTLELDKRLDSATASKSPDPE